MSSNTDFFKESKEQSRIKAEIVAAYFGVWAKVVMPSVKKRNGEIAYIDLFAGPGRYDDGAKSTPILILEQAINDIDMQKRLKTIFNDRDLNATNDLEKEIISLPNIRKLTYKPEIMNKEVGIEIVNRFEEMEHVPTLFFIDPWGYKGLSLRLINSVLKHWGCDCIFFFNYNRINMGINNEKIESHMDALFGEKQTKQLRSQIENLTPEDREKQILQALEKSLKDMGGKYFLPFKFEMENQNRTSHYLIFVTKHIKGYEIMKDVMAKRSSVFTQGVPSFSYSKRVEEQPTLFDTSEYLTAYSPLDDLCEMLPIDFVGQKLTMKQIFENHHVGKSYIKTNYKQALKMLESERRIITYPPSEERRRGTFGDSVKVTFPPKEEL